MYRSTTTNTVSRRCILIKIITIIAATNLNDRVAPRIQAFPVAEAFRLIQKIPQYPLVLDKPPRKE